jgi:hypothetical protein
MDLKTFVKTTLLEIAEGIKDAQDVVGTRAGNAKINPETHYGQDKGHGKSTPVDFDVALTVSDKSEGEVHGGLKVAGIGIGGKKAGESTQEVVSRIRFSVQLAQPAMIIVERSPDLRHGTGYRS